MRDGRSDRPTSTRVASRARWAAADWWKRTKAEPRERPVCGSIVTRAYCSGPNLEKLHGGTRGNESEAMRGKRREIGITAERELKTGVEGWG